MRYSLLTILFVAACSAVPGQDLRKEYIETTRNLGLTPVYPPREEFQVGDVFFVSYNKGSISEIDQTDRMWVGTIDGLRRSSNEYLQSRFDLADTQFQGTSNNLAGPERQTDITDGRVAASSNSRTSLPIVGFPSVSGSSSSAGALGGFDFARSFGVGFGQSEQVSLDFRDTRAFGLPEGALAGLSVFYPEYKSAVCPNLLNAFTISPDVNQQTNQLPTCAEGRTCEVHLISRTYLTRELQFTYTSARIARIALNRLGQEPSVAEGEEQRTLALPGNLDVSITIPEEADGNVIEGLVASLASGIGSSRSADTATDGLSFSGLQANGLVFNRTFRKPVTIAYESLTLDLQSAASLCAEE